MLDTALVQLALWMETPNPRVMNPTMGSPGRGLQHLANLMGVLSKPSTTTPSVEWTLRRSTLGSSGAGASAAFSFWYSSLNLGIQLAMVMPP